MNRLAVIDGHSILYRAYHALPTSLTTSNGQIVNAVYGFTSMLLRVITELKPTHLIVTFDTPEPTFRNSLYKDYQAQRPKADDEFIAQIDVVKKVVAEMGISMFEKDGFEADDVIGTIAFQASGFKVENIQVIIVTSDRDMLQLVNDNKIKLYMPVKGLSRSMLYGEKEVEERMGVKSSQIIDYKGLVGDPSDNYPGIPGIGRKSAEKLLGVWGTLENIYSHLSSIDGKLARKLFEHKESAFLSKKLATIVTDAPVTLDLDMCILKNFDKPNVHHMLEELEFRSLIPKLSTKIKDQKSNIKDTNQKLKSEENKDRQISLF